MTARNFWFTYIRAELLLRLRKPVELILPLAFYVLVVALFPLAIGPDPASLSPHAPGFIWLASLLATLLTLDSLFKQESETGFLGQWLLSSRPLAGFCLCKIFVHWLMTGVPLLLLTPVIAQILYLPDQILGQMLLSLLLATPSLSLLGAMGAALSVGLRNSAMVLVLLILPLYIPLYLLAVPAVQLAALNMDNSAQLLLLSAYLLLALCSAPFVCASALRAAEN